MTLSFVPDGTDVSGQPSQLFDTFNGLASDGQWQRNVERAFNNWAIHTNADIAVVDDGGHALGEAGRRQGDARFGDIRVAAIPLAEDIMAISFPTDHAALGTWSSDIVFNSNIDWASLEQLESVALHEAGHIFGLAHSQDPHSAMHVHGASNITQPNQGDIHNLQFLFGDRQLDRHEVESDNDESTRATSLSQNFGGELLTLSYGDISTVGDVDLYRIATEEEVEGVISIRVASSGLSLMNPVVQLFADEDELVASTMGVDGVVTLNYEFEDESDDVFIRVLADANGISPVGRYSIAATVFEEDFDDDEYEHFEDGELYSIDENELPEYILSLPGEYFFDDESNGNDRLANALAIVPRSNNAGRTWYEEVGSISTENDKDIYLVTAPEDDDAIQSVLTVNVHPIETGGLIPHVHVLDAEGARLPAQIVVNGNGEFAIQLDNVESEEAYYIVVESARLGTSFGRGNYQLNADFGSDLVALHEFSLGTLVIEDSFQLRELHLATPQLVHFLLESQTEIVTEGDVIALDVFDSTGRVVFSLVSRPGETRSGANPLLLPGTYTVRVGLDRRANVTVPVQYQIRGTAVSNPLGVVPVNPTNDPIFQCDGVVDLFCYPGGTTSESPFFWDEFLTNVSDPKATENSDSNLDLIWWPPLTPTQPTKEPSTPLPAADNFRVRQGQLVVPANKGVLQNDAAGGSSNTKAIKLTDPKHGSVKFFEDGGFEYVPRKGFWGVDSFSYAVLLDDVRSAPTVVTLGVSQPGDIDDDGNIAFSDFLQFAAQFGKESANWSDGDFDGDGVVNFQDFLLMTANYGATVAGAQNSSFK